MPGFIAVSTSHRAPAAPDLAALLAELGAEAPCIEHHAGIRTATWGMNDAALGECGPLLLSRTARRRDRALDPDEIGRMLATDRERLAEMHPTFAAAARLGDGVVAAADHLGFRHLYHGERDGVAVLSTSARAVGACLGRDLDAEAVAVQSLLGWQLGQRTLFAGVRKLGPGEVALLRDGHVELHVLERPGGSPARELDAAVADAAAVLQRSLEAFLDDHPDAVLQLTGGQDSRLLLSAIPRGRRSDVRTLTLVTPGNPDGEMAARLSGRYGMEHEILRLDGLDDVSPEEAHRRCVNAARELECMADPLAHAALAHAESRARPGARISGLGGEVARGFYYLGRAAAVPVTRARVERLTRWRMFANEAVPADALDPAFAAWAGGLAVDEVYALTAGTGQDWMAATDEFYLWQRMQRWAGIVGTAVCLERRSINPMLDDRFIEIARALPPDDKRNSRFLSRLQVALDDELAGIPLDGRPAPRAYATRSVRNAARQAASTARKGARKARQRAARATRPPAGGEVLAGKVIEHWRADPAALDAARSTGIFREAWIERLLAGEVDPAPSAVALLINLGVAGEVASGASRAAVRASQLGAAATV